ncbi:MAG TPA: hypothetical protein VFU17_16590 [Candidatus Limnocylindrales bacterium]|nr:hypothetical protein [Candidatus Limnocylindrales bacterium]
MIEVWITSPPHRDSVVAELQIHHESTVDQPVEIFRVDGKLMIALYVSPERHPIELPLGEFLEAVGKSIDELGA